MRKPVASLSLFLCSAILFSAETPQSRLNRANDLMRSGSYEPAQAELKILLHEVEQSGAPKLLFGILNSLAAIDIEMERYEDAERLYLRSVPVWEALPPPQRAAETEPDLNLLALYVQAGWLKKAEDIADRVTTADSGPRQIRVLDGLGNLRCAQKRFSEAEGFYRQALALAGASVEQEIAGTLWNSLGVALASQRKWNDAIDAFQQALTHHEGTWGGEHPVLIPTLTNLGGICLEQKRSQEAVVSLARARRLAESNFGSSYPGLYQILVLLARSYDRTKQTAQAKATRLEAELLRQSAGIPHRVNIHDLARR
jgi:tetratricopeptide (TPR) repeat protein